MMSSRDLRSFLRLRDKNPLTEPDAPVWTLLPGAPRAPGIGHNGGPPLGGAPVNDFDAPNAGPHDFMPAKSDCSKPDIGAAPRPDLI